MRTYLALWVLLCHVLWLSGYTEQVLSGPIKLLVQGRWAVDVFMIISGFVIFFVLDRQQESWPAFLVRRFFRLFPLFIVLFLTAIAVCALTSWNLALLGKYWAPDQLQYMRGLLDSWWQNIHWHLPVHLLMIHGALPQSLLPESPGAFLVSAWSISLEWQFYVVAPLAFFLATSSKRFYRTGLCVMCALLFVAGRKFFPSVDFGAALPFHLEFFFIGCASYFLYKRNSEQCICDTWFPVCCAIAFFFLALGGRSLLMLPVALWIAFFGLMLEHPDSLPARCITPLFTARFPQFLGRVSYSIYLVHVLVIAVAQRALLILAPQLSQFAHFWLLLALTFAITIPVSALLYHFVEAPGIRLGRFFALKLASAPDRLADRTETRAREIIIAQP
jgi:peptidoglycan/LPS O-acetylase OafA/YrhL